MTERGLHWRASCLVNGCLGGRFSEPTCSRAWRRGWSLFVEVMAICWRCPTHCEEIHIRWLEIRE